MTNTLICIGWDEFDPVHETRNNPILDWMYEIYSFLSQNEICFNYDSSLQRQGIFGEYGLYLEIYDPEHIPLIKLRFPKTHIVIRKAKPHGQWIIS